MCGTVNAASNAKLARTAPAPTGSGGPTRNSATPIMAAATVSMATKAAVRLDHSTSLAASARGVWTAAK